MLEREEFTPVVLAVASIYVHRSMAPNCKCSSRRCTKEIEHDGVVGGRVGASGVGASGVGVAGVHGSGGGSGHWSVVMQPMLSFIRCLSTYTADNLNLSTLYKCWIQYKLQGNRHSVAPTCVLLALGLSGSTMKQT